jgi:hypothetical protein
MPGSLQLFAMTSQVANDITDFVRRESRVGRDREVVEPEFRFLAASPNMNVRGFAPSLE